MLASRPSKRRFSEAARAAAMEARRRKREEAVPLDTPEVFVVRRPDAGLGYGWEIRRFGGVVIDREDVGYSTPGAARSAGVQALSDTKVPG